MMCGTTWPTRCVNKGSISLPKRRTDREGRDELVADFEDGTDANNVVLYATGRAPNSRGIGLEEAGVELKPARSSR